MSDLLEQRKAAAVNAVAEAIHRLGEDWTMEDVSEAALLASDAVLAQAGMVVVPREPSRSMIDAAYKVLSCDDKGTTATRIGYLMWGWSTMIDAFVNPGDGG